SLVLWKTNILGSYLSRKGGSSACLPLCSLEEQRRRANGCGRCIENYTGARCEEVFLPSSSIPSESNLSAAFVVLAVLLTLTIAALCFLCRARVELTLQDICEMLKGRLKKWKGHLQRASSVQCEISLVETSNTRTCHSE
uniref:Uncharacterized protein n=1 Tax=Mus spicilegus TaxID=10103 RepID=A0A8C6GFR8_MUSSI